MAENYEQQSASHLAEIAKMIKEQNGVFARIPLGGAGDNSDIIEAIEKESSEKKKATDKQNKELVKEYKRTQKITEDGMNTISDALKHSASQAKALQSLSQQIKMSGDKQFESAGDLQKELDKLEEYAENAGTSLKELDIKGFKPLRNSSQKQVWAIKDVNTAYKKSTEMIEVNSDATQTLIDKSEILSEQYDKAHKNLQKFGGFLKTTAKNFAKYAEQEQRFAQATATADAGWIDGMVNMRISQLDYMKILKDTRQEGLAASAAGVDFKASLTESTTSLRYLTATNEDAAKGAAMFHKNVARMGVAQENLGDAVKDQEAIYKSHYRGLGYTVEEFANLTNELINDQGMRSVLLGLQENERKAYILSTQQRMSEYQQMGYTIERAKELQKTFQALNKMNPKERMKQAAKQRAMMGALGLGAEGAEMFKLQTEFRTMGPEEKAAAEKRMTEINAMASKQFGEMSGSGASVGQAMSMQMIADATGFTAVAETFEVESGKGLEVAQNQLKSTNEISGFAKEILHLMGTFDAMSSSGMGSIVTGAIAGVGALLMGRMIPKLLAKLAGGSVGKIFSGGAGGMVKGAGKLVAGGLGLGAAGAAANAAPSALKGATAGVAGVAAKGITKGLAKTALKAIPGIGLIAALGFMGSRLADGDFLGAGMELASGALGLVPGVGTAASIAMSGAIVARDISSAQNGMDTQLNEDGTVTPSIDVAAKKETKADNPIEKLNTTMENINTYIRSSGESNTEMASVLRSLGITMEEQARMQNINGPRTAGG